MSITPIGTAGIQSAIQAASRKTGIDFDYLLGQAKVESGLNASARAGTSSASGLYQFIEQSWLGVVKKHGAEHGLSWAADSIQGSGGRYSVSGGGKQAILALRNNPEVASLMAAEHASDNKAALESSLGRDATAPTSTWRISSDWAAPRRSCRQWRQILAGKRQASSLPLPLPTATSSTPPTARPARWSRFMSGWPASWATVPAT